MWPGVFKVGCVGASTLDATYILRPGLEQAPHETNMTDQHKWTEPDDIVAFYLSRYGPSALARSVAAAAEKLGIESGTLQMRIGNFKFLDGNGRLNHPAKQSRRVYDEYKDIPEKELRAIAARILSGQK